MRDNNPHLKDLQAQIDMVEQLDLETADKLKEEKKKLDLLTRENMTLEEDLECRNKELEEDTGVNEVQTAKLDETNGKISEEETTLNDAVKELTT